MTQSSSDGTGDCPKLLGEYEIIEELARGGMGVVYRARQINADRVVALKLIRGTNPSAEESERFQAEARAAAMLDHPAIVPIYDVGTIAGEPFFTMKLIDGLTLSERLDGKPIDARIAAGIVRDVAAGIAHAHERGVIHRDLKPSNVLLEENDRPLVTDFGLAKRSGAVSGLTRTGQPIGTPGYMSPEQATGEKSRVDHRSDVYSMGAVLYACLTGRPPFQGTSAMATVIAMMRDDPVAPRLLNPDVPKDIETICLKCLEKGVESRYPSALALHDDLSRFLALEPIRARAATKTDRAIKWVRRNPLAAGLVGAVGLAIASVSALLVAWSFNDSLSTALETSRVARREAVSQQLISESALNDARTANRAKEKAEYYTQVAIAQLAYQQGDWVGFVKALSDAQPERRGWEHNYLANLRDQYKWRTTLPSGGYVFQLHYDASHDRLTATGYQESNDFSFFDADNGEFLWSENITPRRLGMEERGLFSVDRAEVLMPTRDVKIVRIGIDHDSQILEERQRVRMPRYTEGLVKSRGGDLAVCEMSRHQNPAKKPRLGIIALNDQLESFSVECPVRPIACCFSLDDQSLFVTGRRRGEPNTWLCEFKTEDWELVSSTPLDTNDGSHMAISKDGTWLAISDHRRVLRLDIPSGSVVTASNPTNSGIEQILFSPNGKYLAVARHSGDVERYSAADMSLIHVYRGLSRAALALCFHPSSQILYAGGEENVVLAFDLKQQRLPRHAKLHSADLRCVAISPDCQRIVTAGQSTSRDAPSIVVSDIHSLRPILTLSSDHPQNDEHVNSVQYLGWIDNGSNIITASYFQTLFFWDAATGELQEVVELDGVPGLMDGCTSSDGRWLGTCGIDKSARLVDLQTRSLQQRYKARCELRGVAIDAGNKRLFATGSVGGEFLYSWPLENEAAPSELAASPIPDAPRDIVFVPQSNHLIFGGINGYLIQGSATNLTRVPNQYGDGNPLHKSTINAITVSPDGTRCVSGSDNGNVIVRETTTLAPIIRLEGHESSVLCASFSSDGRIVATGDSSGNIFLWEGK